MSSGVMSTPSSPSLMMPPEMVLATSVERNAPTRLRIAAMPTATFGLQRARGDRRRHRVRRVVEAVREVEEERQCDDQHDDEGEFHRRLSLDRWCESPSVQRTLVAEAAYAVPRRYYATDSVLSHHGGEVLTEHEGTPHAAPGEHPGQPAARVVPHLVERHRVEREPLGIELVGCPTARLARRGRRTRSTPGSTPRGAGSGRSAVRAARGRMPRTTTPDSSNTSRTAASDRRLPRFELAAESDEVAHAQAVLLASEEHLDDARPLAQEVADADLGQRHPSAEEDLRLVVAATGARG